MPRAPTARRYAQAFFQIALEQKNQEGGLAQLELIADALRDGAFAALLAAPQIRLADKLRAVDEVLASLSPLAKNLVALLASRGSISLVPAVLRHYQRLLDVYMGIERASVVTAVPLDDHHEEQVAQLLQALMTSEVKITPRVDPAILGGMVARVGDRLIDGSTKTRLQNMRKKLTEASS